MAKKDETVAPVIVEPVVEETNAVVNEEPTADAPALFPEGAQGEFVGIISTSRTLAAATMTGGVQTRQALLLLTIRRGKDKFQCSVGADIIGAREEFATDGFRGKAVEVTYEVCIKGVTGYEDKEGKRHAHSFTGNRVVNVEPMDEQSYMDYMMFDRDERNVTLVANCANNAAAVAAYLNGNI